MSKIAIHKLITMLSKVTIATSYHCPREFPGIADYLCCMIKVYSYQVEKLHLPVEMKLW